VKKVFALITWIMTSVIFLIFFCQGVWRTRRFSRKCIRDWSAKVICSGNSRQHYLPARAPDGGINGVPLKWTGIWFGDLPYLRADHGDHPGTE
jgi:hypothetical protein